MTFQEKLNYFFQLPIERKAWFLFSIASSGIIALSVKWIKPNKLRFIVGTHMENKMLCILATETQMLKAWRIARVVEAVCQGVPWQCTCLVEALCITLLLKLYRIPAVCYFGAKIEPREEHTQDATGKLSDQAKIKAHAWLTVGKYTIIGGQVAGDGYTVTATFTRPKIAQHQNPR